jgi:transposase
VQVQVKSWIEKTQQQGTAQNAFSKATRYHASEWKKLERYVEKGYVSLDNSVAERATCPFAIGRKNWQSSDTYKRYGQCSTLQPDRDY